MGVWTTTCCGYRRSSGDLFKSPKLDAGGIDDVGETRDDVFRSMASGNGLFVTAATLVNGYEPRLQVIEEVGLGIDRQPIRRLAT